jgi:hypothetical protein
VLQWKNARLVSLLVFLSFVAAFVGKVDLFNWGWR